MQTVDIYQEALIALRFKAIPGFKRNKGMSFLNFAKMCIRRHLITLLHASRNRKKDYSINQAISIDSSPASNNDSDDKGTFSNIIPDSAPIADEQYETSEAYEVTLDKLSQSLSEFEKTVLEEYLKNESYTDIAKNVSKKLQKGYNEKSIDNALFRIRNKATEFKKRGKDDDLPLFIKK